MGPEQKQIMWFSNMFTEFVLGKKKKQPRKCVGKAEAEALIKLSTNRKRRLDDVKGASRSLFFL